MDDGLTPAYFKALKLAGWKYYPGDYYEKMEIFTGVEYIFIAYCKDGDKRPYKVYSEQEDSRYPKQCRTIEEAEAWVIARIEKNLTDIEKAIGKGRLND
jgi:hypothetical protein